MSPNRPLSAGRITVLAALVLVALAGCGGAPAEQEPAATPEAASSEPAVDAEAAVVTDDAGTRVTLTVTNDGFVPALVTVPSGKPVTLVVTRKTDRTCATELVMKAYAIDLALPLDQTVEATFTPTQAETLDYACAMDMIKGQIVVQ